MFLFETHLHTAETSPCARIPAAESVAALRGAGYAGTVVTDHYSPYVMDRMGEMDWREKIRRWTAGFRAALKAAEGTGFRVICGMELSFRGLPNDYLVYGAEPAFLEEHRRLHEMDPASFSAFAKEHGLCFLQAHPFREYCTRTDPALLDGVEVWNGNPRQNSHNELALEMAEKYSLIKTSGSDYHQREDLGAGGIYLPRLPENAADFAGMLLAGDVLGLMEHGKP